VAVGVLHCRCDDRAQEPTKALVPHRRASESGRAKYEATGERASGRNLKGTFERLRSRALKFMNSGRSARPRSYSIAFKIRCPESYRIVSEQGAVNLVAYICRPTARQPERQTLTPETVVPIGAFATGSHRRKTPQAPLEWTAAEAPPRPKVRTLLSALQRHGAKLKICSGNREMCCIPTRATG